MTTGVYKHGRIAGAFISLRRGKGDGKRKSNERKRKMLAFSLSFVGIQGVCRHSSSVSFKGGGGGGEGDRRQRFLFFTVSFSSVRAEVGHLTILQKKLKFSGRYFHNGKHFYLPTCAKPFKFFKFVEFPVSRATAPAPSPPLPGYFYLISYRISRISTSSEAVCDRGRSACLAAAADKTGSRREKFCFTPASCPEKNVLCPHKIFLSKQFI